MSTKKISIGSRPTKTSSEAVDAWVEYRGEKEMTKRLTIDVSESLHRAIKAQCAMRGTKIADEIRILLLQKYGNTEIQK